MSPTAKRRSKPPVSDAVIATQEQIPATESEDSVLYPLCEEAVAYARETYPLAKQPTVIALLLAEGIDVRLVPSNNAFFEDGYITMDWQLGKGQLNPWPSENFGKAVLEVSAIEDASAVISVEAASD